MLHHLELYASDLKASRAFWKGILIFVGYEESARWDDGFTLENQDGAYLTFVQRLDKYASLKYHRCGVGLNHIAFKVDGRAAVDSLRQYSIDHDITCLYDDRYPFANGDEDYYSLFVEDPDRIKVEFVAD